MDKIEEMRKKLIEGAKKKVQQSYEAKDVHIIKSVNILEDIDPISNLLIEQLREWYSVHFPELNEIALENDDYLKLLYHIGKREGFTKEKILEHVNNEEIAGQIAGEAEKSIGSSIGENDLDEMKALALNCLNLREEREHLEKYLEQAMQKELPHFTEIAGAVIGAKILAKTGSKRKLALIPSSTIQIIGAEKALFMHFKKGARPPKHGYLYQHPLIKAAKKEDKGRLSRSIAAKLSIAAKMDYFGNTSGANLKESLEKRVQQLHGAQKKPSKETLAPARRERYEGFENEKRIQYFPKRDDKESPRRERKEFVRRDDGEKRNFRSKDRYGRPHYNFRETRPRSEFRARPYEDRKSGEFKPRTFKPEFKEREPFSQKRGEFKRKEGFAPREERGFSRGANRRDVKKFGNTERKAFNKDDYSNEKRGPRNKWKKFGNKKREKFR